jgi:hypothetical protein
MLKSQALHETREELSYPKAWDAELQGGRHQTLEDENHFVVERYLLEEYRRVPQVLFTSSLLVATAICVSPN